MHIYVNRDTSQNESRVWNETTADSTIGSTVRSLIRRTVNRTNFRETPLLLRLTTTCHVDTTLPARSTIVPNSSRFSIFAQKDPVVVWCSMQNGIQQSNVEIEYVSTDATQRIRRFCSRTRYGLIKSNYVTDLKYSRKRRWPSEIIW